jgi:molecular chaperone GrpE (heat shock protein)
LAKNVKNLVFPETVPLESTQEMKTAESMSFVDTPLVSENSPVTSAASEPCENPSAQESAGDEDSATSEPPLAEPTSLTADQMLSELKPMLFALETKLDSLTQNVDFGTKFAEKKQEQIDKLYEENQEYKQGIHEKFKKSLILVVIGQIDAAFKTISHFGNQEFSEENYRKLLANYNEIVTDFQDSLAQSFDVTAFNSEENTSFDAKRQRTLKTVPTEDETKHKTISKSIRQGYEIANADGTKTLLRLEMVEVYVHQSSQS